MPAPINIVGSFLLGSGLALVTQRAPALHRELLSWPLLFLLLFQAAVVTPLVTLLFRFYPHWSLFYAFDPQIYPELGDWWGALSGALVITVLGAGLLGYATTRTAILRGEHWLRFGPPATAGTILLVLLWFVGERTLYVGEYADYWSGRASFLLTQMAGWAGLILYGGSATFLWWVRSRFGHREPSLF